MPPASSAADARRAERRRRQQLLDGAPVVAEPATEPAAVSMQSELNISSNVAGADSALARRRAARKARQAALDAGGSLEAVGGKSAARLREPEPEPEPEPMAGCVGAAAAVGTARTVSQVGAPLN
jgi:hypothetical protein